MGSKNAHYVSRLQSILKERSYLKKNRINHLPKSPHDFKFINLVKSKTNFCSYLKEQGIITVKNDVFIDENI